MIDEVRAHVEKRIGELDGLVGLRKTAEGIAPHLFKEGDDLSQLALNPRYPLAPVVSLLHKRYPKARLGVVARACDIRALVEMAKRMQVDPERLYLLGIACTAEETEACYCTDPAFRIEGWPQAEVIGTPAKAGPPNPIIAEYEGMSLQERNTFWQQQFLKCIKCYGCRNICPECFCESCSLENPLWVEKGVLAPPFPTYHLIRAMHMSGRCVACRQCELACPAHIPLTILHDLIRRDVEELMSYVPGMDLDAQPPMSLTLEEAPIQVKIE
jgi:ferredoxin